MLFRSLAPSMDIVVSSNFERLLFDLYEQDGAAVASLLEDFQNQATQLDPKAWAKAQEVFASLALDDATILKVIADAFKRTGELLDPHTATGYLAAQKCSVDPSIPVITLATAHPAKFEEAIIKAGFTEGAALPEHMAGLLEREERYTVLPADLKAVQAHLVKVQSKS